MFPCSEMMKRRKGWSLWSGAMALVLASVLAALGAKRLREGALVVQPSVENFRDAPNGKKMGTLVEGIEVEKISQEGKWVRFRVEGWVWGPSLEGFEEEKAEEAAAVKEGPKLPLQDNLPRIKRYINETHGVFYSIDLDEDLQRLTVRFRVKRLEREALERKQLAVQREVLTVLEGKVDFTSIRVETNRPDGSGAVGVEIAETEVEELKGDISFAEWKGKTRLSSDGGATWSR